ncbi:MULTISPECIES: hypothetical protein [Mesorhizobium]|uniref:hypothetical protein n=1 Tax=Mesorhizobium TaxID=68287 RepID=UPI0003CF4554|nr:MULTISPECIES: hypothetical protein [Mesorhizobium]ESY63733.1 hypothetical protein X742_28420 [Mesorhizobium sp. LNHC232B00]WJI41460.1 hypothetical protein NL534_14930 [Mesorhizobium opportunistum]
MSGTDPIFTDLDMRFAPWITPKRLHDHGMLMVWPGSRVPPQLHAWLDNIQVKTVLFNWSQEAPPVAISFAAIPPGARLPVAVDGPTGQPHS